MFAIQFPVDSPHAYLGTVLARYPLSRIRPTSKTPLKLDRALLLFELVSGSRRRKFSEAGKAPVLPGGGLRRTESAFFKRGPR
jgi:hypothetical protein